MKFYFLLLLSCLLFSCNPNEKSNKVINGIMIDCARLLERQDYYYRLIDFMSDWNMNTLVLHFSDDHGISVRLPGFEKLARSNAFTPTDISHLVDYGMSRGIEIIPEIETFGHTRFITDHPDYEHLYAGTKTENISFNAINPLNPQTILLIESMIKKVAEMFPSEYIHLGCDEVNLEEFCKRNNCIETKVWTEYVNKLIDIVHKNKKKPIIWNDHVHKNKEIAENLNKNVILMEWNYDPAYKPTKLNALKELGYNEIIMAPSIACYRLRVIPAKPGLQNTNEMAKSVRQKNAKGLINTIWLPMRYLQNAMWYGIAYSGYLIDSDKIMNLRSFHENFAIKVFDKPLTENLNNYLESWTDLHLDYKFYISISNGEFDFSNDPIKIKSLNMINALSKRLIDEQPEYIPSRNIEILESIYLAPKILYTISEGLLIYSDKSASIHRKVSWQQELKKVIDVLDKEWNNGRYTNDPNKYKAKYPNQEHSHLLIILNKLQKYGIKMSSVYN